MHDLRSIILTGAAILLPLAFALLSAMRGRAGLVAARVGHGALLLQLVVTGILLVTTATRATEQTHELFRIAFSMPSQGSLNYAPGFRLDGFAAVVLLAAPILTMVGLDALRTSRSASSLARLSLFALNGFALLFAVAIDGLTMSLALVAGLASAVGVAVGCDVRRSWEGVRSALPVLIGGGALVCAMFGGLGYSVSEHPVADGSARSRTLSIANAVDRRYQIPDSPFALSSRAEEDTESVNGVRGFAAIATSIFFALLMAAFPLHAWTFRLVESQPSAAGAAVGGILSLIGLLGFARISLGLFPDLFARSGTWLAVLGAATVLYGPIVACGEADPQRRLRYGALFWNGAALLCMANLSPSGITFGTILVAAGTFFVAGTAWTAMRRSRRSVALALSVSGLAALILVVLGGAIDLAAIRDDLFSPGSVYTLCAVIGGVVYVVSLIGTGERAPVHEAPSDTVRSARFDNGSAITFASIILGIMLLFTVVRPKLDGAARETVKAIEESSREPVIREGL